VAALLELLRLALGECADIHSFFCLFILNAITQTP